MVPFRQEAQRLAADWGIHLPGVTHYATEPHSLSAMDDASGTGPLPGIPDVLTTTIDPQVVRALVTPTRSEQIYGSGKKGDRTRRTMMFPVAESAGYVAPYGDYEPSGVANTHISWVSRESFYFQTWARYGDLDVQMLGLAGVALATEQRLAGATVLNKASNKMNLFGINGRALYGALNDPRLPAAIQPTAKASPGGKGTVTSWTDTNDAIAVYGDFVSLFTQLTQQLAGQIDTETELVAVIPSERAPVLKYIVSYGLTLEDMLKKGFPNMVIRTLPEAGPSLSGGAQSVAMMQLFVPRLDGVDTVTTAFTEKLLMHRLETYSSYMQQKMSQGGWGTVWRRPQACATMMGI